MLGRGGRRREEEGEEGEEREEGKGGTMLLSNGKSIVADEGGDAVVERQKKLRIWRQANPPDTCWLAIASKANSMMLLFMIDMAAHDGLLSPMTLRKRRVGGKMNN